MANITIDIDFDASDFDEALGESQGLSLEQAESDCWALVGQFHALVEDYAADHPWALRLYNQLEVATDAMEADRLITVIDDISLDLAIDAPNIASMGGKALRALRAYQGFDRIGLMGSGLP